MEVKKVDWMTLRDAAIYVGVDERTARRWYDENDFAMPYRFGKRKLLWRKDDIDKWIETKKVNK